MRFENIVAVNINMSQSTRVISQITAVLYLTPLSLCEFLLDSVIVKAVYTSICSAALWLLQVAVRCSATLTNCTFRVVTWGSVL